MKHGIVLLLIVALLISALASCQNGESGPKDTAAVSDGTAETGSGTPDESGSSTDDLPDDLRFDGKSFRMLTYKWGNIGEGWSNFLLVDEPEEGDLLQLAAYQRNAEIEARFDVAFELEDTQFAFDNTQSDIAYFLNVIGSSGDDMYDMAVLQGSDKSTLLTEELLYDIGSLPYINWDKPYYIQNMNDTYACGSHRYVMFSDIQYPSISTPAFFVNIGMLNDRGRRVEELYQMVEDGTRTVDAVLTLIDGMYKDVNNDEKKDVGDEYGYGCHPVGPVYFWPAAGLKGTYMTDTGLAFDYGTDRAIAAVEKALTFVENPYVFCSDWAAGTMFQEGRCLFTTWTQELRMIREWDIKVGILPIPKYDEVQDRYYAVVSDTPLVVPATIGDPDFVGAMLEAFSAGSYKYMLPAFYTNFMQQKVFQDDGSRANWERMMGEWSTCELVRVFCPDSRIENFGTASACIQSDFHGYASSWGKQEEALKNICSEYYQIFLKD